MANLRDLLRHEPQRGIELPGWLERLISVGIRSDDPQLARRQRCTNVATFALLANALWHLLANAIYDFEGLFIVNVYNLLMAVVALAVPQLHRLGSNVAGITLALIVAVGNLFAVWAVGLASNLHIYFTLAGAMLFLFGVENLKLFLVFFLLYVGALLFALNYAPVHGLVLPADDPLHNMLSSSAMINTVIINAALIFYALTALRKAEAELEHQYARSEALVSAVLPASIAARLKSGADSHIADRIENLSVMFADLVGFTEASHDMPPDRVVAYLDDLVRGFEDLCEENGVDKIKSIGDGCMAVAGLEGDPRMGAIAVGELALAMIAENAARPPLGNHKLGLRIGLHCGSTMAGVIGGTRFSYDVWGDAVNMAARMESTSEPDRIQVSEAFRALAGDYFRYEERGSTELKGIGMEKTYFLLAVRADLNAQ